MTASRRHRVKAALTPAEWRRAAGLAAVIAGLHLIGFLVLVAGPLGVGLGVTAYTLGLRHALDADHLAAIDNTTRKLMSEGQRPLGIGFFFSLGHSSVVFALGALVVLGVRGLGGAVRHGGSTLHQATGLVGPVVSGSFLLLIGVLNLLLLVSIVRVSRRMRLGDFDEAELEAQFDRRGVMNRFYGRATRAISRSWQMYPLGCLFGLGFDTATEIALLVLAGAGAAGGLPVSAILCLPVLFAAGMCLIDTLDGAFMNFAYGWALSRPIRKIFYNIALTGLSVAVALLIGTIELVSVLADRLNLRGAVWSSISNLDLNLVGYVVVGLCVATWALALAIWRFGRIEERWSANLQQP